MLNRALYLASGLSMALMLVWSVAAQPPEQTPNKAEGPRPGFDNQGGPGGGFRAGPGRRAGRGGGFSPGGSVERILADLKLSEKNKDQAQAAVKAYEENVRKLMSLARSDLLLKMKDVLSEQEFKKFTETLDRPPAFADGRGRRGAGFGGNRGLTVDQIVERIMSFDKNGDGKITKDELPERMQNLIARGDTNNDGVLDKEEIRKLATELARNGPFRRLDDRGLRGAGLRPGPGAIGGFFPGAGPERALDDLQISGNNRETAETALRAHRDNVRKLMDLARADLLLKMTEVLSAEQFKDFKLALNRQPGFGARPTRGGGPLPGATSPGGSSRSEDLEKKLDQLQKDLDNLRREIRR